MADKYMQPVNNHFAFEDVDDNVFLARRPNNNGNTDITGSSSVESSIDRSPSFEDHRLQSYQQKRREIEERSLQSTQRSLNMLYDTEQVGNATAVELAKQRDQLERTNKNLDDINASLRYSQRHLNSIKSVFGSIKNHLFGTRENTVPNNPNTERKLSADASATPKARTEGVKTTIPSPSDKYDQHPISRIREDSSHRQQLMQSQQGRQNNPFEQQLEANLNEMSDNLSRLKGLATELGSEIEYQNDLLDNMTYKVEDVDLKLSRQNKDISKLLGKK
ncbi:synaptosomal-associated protein 29 [Musca vetustissima]|uniref:synaptosomal-associated protein 29 n=1 Tax=Musca vetustissima TaxID=27455 RepID=UPI002AB72060|nr:synaptosomal-associated protein 29 [Musca vetustissima]